MIRTLAAALVVWWWLAGAALAAGPKEARARALYDRAVRQYNVGAYQDAARDFQAAYLLSGQVGLLYNIAQSYRLAGDCGEALRAYRSFLRAEPRGPANEPVRRRIEEMEVCVAARQAPADPASAPAAPASAPAAPMRPPPLAPVQREPDRDATPWWAYGAWGAGIVFAGGGAALYASTSAKVDDCSPRCSPARLDTLRTRADIAYVLLGAGGASAVAGLWLWLARPASGEPAVGVALQPAGVSLWGAF